MKSIKNRIDTSGPGKAAEVALSCWLSARCWRDCAERLTARVARRRLRSSRNSQRLSTQLSVRLKKGRLAAH